MNHKLRIAKLRLRRFRYLMKWFYQFNFNQIRSYQNISDMNLPSKFKSLILVPHADDEWIGNSQVLLRTNSTVYYFQFLGNNYNESNKKIRLEEIKKLQKEVGFELIVSSNYEDYSDLEKLMNEFDYTDVFIPYPIDWHKEHIKVNTIFNSILLKEKRDIKLHFYHVSVPFSEKVKGECLNLTKEELVNKNNIFAKIYQSQYNTPISRLNYQSRLNAKGKDVYACENFATLSFEEWVSLLDYVNVNYESKIYPLIHQIDNLIQIRELSNQIYNDWQMKKNN